MYSCTYFVHYIDNRVWEVVSAVVQLSSLLILDVSVLTTGQQYQVCSDLDLLK